MEERRLGKVAETHGGIGEGEGAVALDEVHDEGAASGKVEGKVDGGRKGGDEVAEG